MPTTRLLPILLLMPMALAGCDGILGPSSLPATMEIRADRYAFDRVGETTVLETVVRDRDGRVIENPSLRWSIRDSAVVGVQGDGVIQARANGETWVVARAGEAADSAQVTVDSPIPCLETGDLSVPDTVSDRIDPEECGPEQRYTDVWRLEIGEAREITLDLVSPDFDTFLGLLDADGNVLGVDNDGGPAFNSRLRVSLNPGVYYVLATPFSVGGQGSYELRVIEGARPSRCPATQSVSFPDTVAGETSVSGSCDFEGFHFDVWRLDLAQSEVVTMQVVGEIGMFVSVTDTLGRFLLGGREGPSNGGWLETRLPAGSYDLWLGPRQRGAVGSYTLEVMEGPSSLVCPTAGAVGINESVNGSLDDQDCYVWFAPSEGWDLAVTDTTDLTLSVTSVEPHVPAILVTDSAGELVGVGYGGLERYARLDTTMVPGSYRVWIQSAELEPGDYQLSVVEAGRVTACEPGDTVVVDSTYEGALSTTDCSLTDGRYADGWMLQLDTAATPTIDLTSDKFDPFLLVTDTAGTVMARDDDSGPGRNASLTLDLEPGTYQLWASSYSPHAIGGYQLALSGAGSAGLVSPDALDDRSRLVKRPEDPDGDALLQRLESAEIGGRLRDPGSVPAGQRAIQAASERSDG